MKKYILPFLAIVSLFLLGVFGVGLMLYGFANPPQPTAKVRALQAPARNQAGEPTQKTAMAAATPMPANTPVPTVVPSPTPVPIMPSFLKVAGVLEASVERVLPDCPEDGAREGYQPGVSWCIPSKAVGYQYEGGDPKKVNKVFNGHSSSPQNMYGNVFRPLVEKYGGDLELTFSDGTVQKYKRFSSEIVDPGQPFLKKPAKDGWILLITCACKAQETKQECWQCIGGYNKDGKCPSGQLYPRHRLAVWYTLAQ